MNRMRVHFNHSYTRLIIVVYSSRKIKRCTFLHLFVPREKQKSIYLYSSFISFHFSVSFYTLYIYTYSCGCSYIILERQKNCLTFDCFFFTLLWIIYLLCCLNIFLWINNFGYFHVLSSFG